MSIDTLKRSALHIYEPEAPFLPAVDALSDRSTIFDSALSTAPWALPAHASVFSTTIPTNTAR